MLTNTYYAPRSPNRPAYLLTYPVPRARGWGCRVSAISNPTSVASAYNSPVELAARGAELIRTTTPVKPDSPEYNSKTIWRRYSGYPHSKTNGK